ncbi:hypothetical protein B0T18DRAFT_386372 [Schizothecium vesticola]|uniref:Ras-associating domain-containing protein n=1 Tax=Schizothecium vesticola TaxID=314040 RepID=A0AA40FB11_9PEZI|nr:hypothetical protein B0T18DRAFT_386372 [Schizothecium vesticola]
MAVPRNSGQGSGQAGNGAVDRELQVSRHRPRPRPGTGEKDADPVVKSWSLGAPLTKTRANKPCVPVPPTTNTTTAAAASLTSRPLPPLPPLPLGQRDLKTLNSVGPRPSTRAGPNDVGRDNCKLLPRPSAGPPIDLFADCSPAWKSATSSSALPASATVPSDRELRAKGRRTKLNQNRQAGLWAVGVGVEVARNETETETETETRRTPPAEHRKGDTGREQRPRLQLSVSPTPEAVLSTPSTAPVPAPVSSPAAPADSFSSSPKTRSPMLDRLKNLAKKHRQKGTPADLLSRCSLSSDNTTSPPLALAPEKSTTTLSMDRPVLEPGGRGQKDAPKGASNGIDRTIPIQCRGTTVDVVIGTKTTASDVLDACSRLAAQRFDPRITILDEIFTPLGLKRHIRRYECIRDVLNSWDSDSQNVLSVRIDALGSHANLELDHALRSEKAPRGFTLTLYHANRSGKWNKRNITLQRCGQVVSHKTPEVDRSDKDTVNICHLSDFDIYGPQEAQMAKQVRPPQKYCYAIKSQEKAAVFGTNDNYVHYFCSDDGDLTQQFHAAVHAWRSWYWATKHLDLGRSEKPSEGPKPALVHAARESISSVRAPLAPHIEEEAPQKPLLAPQPPDTFSPAGLLGTGYEQRKQTMRQEVARAPDLDAGPIIPGTLVSGAGTLGRSASRRVTSRGSMSTTTDTSTSARSRATEPLINLASSEPQQGQGQGWFPSAAEHSRQIQERERQLRARSGYPQPHAGHAGGGPAYPHHPPPHMGRNRAPIQPLINFATTDPHNNGGGGRAPNHYPPSRGYGGRGGGNEPRQYPGLSRRPTVSSATSSGQRSALPSSGGRPYPSSRGGDGYDRRENSPPSPRARMMAGGSSRARSGTTNSEPPMQMQMPLISSIPARMGSTRMVVLPDRNQDSGTGRMVRAGADTRGRG